MRHKLALLVLVCGVLTIAACGDDNDTPPPTPVPTNTSIPVPPTTPPATNTQAPPTLTNTPGNETPPPTATPTATVPEGETANFSCDFSTSFTCNGGSRDGQVCRPARATPQPDDLCPGGECQETQFFCKGGDMNRTPCARPRNVRTPDPCTGGRCQNSELQICTQGTCPIVSRRIGGGRIDIECDKSTRSCSATLDEFDPVDIPGIGYVCVKPVGPPALNCPTGRIECEAGGSGLDYDLLQVHTIGACGQPGNTSDNTGNPQCESMCRTYCESKGSEMVDFGCAGYCKSGGENNEKKDNYCECDSTSGGQGACETLPNCAPDGSCNGKDRAPAEDRNVCGCQCLTEGGNPSRAGSINFRVGAQIIVETAPPCDSGAVLLVLAPQCIPLTTEISSGVLTNANNTDNCPGGLPSPGCAQIPDEGKLVRTGSPTSCDALLDNEDATALNLVGNISFFDSTIGDIETILDWNCK